MSNLSDFGNVIGGLFIGLFFGGAIFFFVGIFTERGYQKDLWKRQIIENNCGYHDPKTGEFTFGGLK
jgi:hypothetical protein